MNISKKAAFAAGVTDFDALARFNRNPYGDHRKAMPKQSYLCVGGPWDGESIVLSPIDCGTLTVRVGAQVGRYAAFTSSTVSWREAA